MTGIMATRRAFLGLGAGLAAGLAWPSSVSHASGSLLPSPGPEGVVQAWHELVLKLVRHTATYSPPVASRAFAYLGIASFEAAATGSKSLVSLAGQLSGFGPVPERDPSPGLDGRLVQHGALSTAVAALFANTGPTGQRVMKAFERKLRAELGAGVGEDMVTRSEAHGRAIAQHVLDWSADDGGAVVETMGFPATYELKPGKANWVPTSTLGLQQKPLLPNWGLNRPFAMPSGNACPLPPPPAYSEDPASDFYREAREVYDTTRALTEEQKLIARFWSDDPMLSPTPPGHWIAIALQIFDRDAIDYETRVETLARLGMTLADAFIGCWHSKFEYDLLRPVTYIKRVIDPKWEPMLITPPFPEYPSGHSTQSGAAAHVLAAMLGESRAFEDTTHVREGMMPRRFVSFTDAAAEAGISRLYGGIHFRAAIERGLEQGSCIGAYATALRMRA